MKTITYKNAIDKSSWPLGEWTDEPDKMQWKDEVTGLPCLIVRGPVGALCGYVGVSKSHPLYGQSYAGASELSFDVHGDLTFFGPCQDDELHGICHQVDPGESDDVWWLGFDCAHVGDLLPDNPIKHSKSSLTKGTYRNLTFVKDETERLALQLKNFKER